MLQANVGDVAIIYDGCDCRRQPHDNPLYVIRLERAPPANNLDRVERSLNR